MRLFFKLFILGALVSSAYGHAGCIGRGVMTPVQSGAINVNFPAAGDFEWVYDDTGAVAAVTVMAFCTDPYLGAPPKPMGQEKLACSSNADAKAIAKKSAERYETYYGEMLRLNSKLKEIWGMDDGDPADTSDDVLVQTFVESAKDKAKALRAFSDGLESGKWTGADFEKFYSQTMKPLLDPSSGLTESFFVAQKVDGLPNGSKPGDDNRTIIQIMDGSGMRFPPGLNESRCNVDVGAEYMAEMAKDLIHWETKPGKATSLDPADAGATK